MASCGWASNGHGVTAGAVRYTGRFRMGFVGVWWRWNGEALAWGFEGFVVDVDSPKSRVVLGGFSPFLTDVKQVFPPLCCFCLFFGSFSLLIVTDGWLMCGGYRLTRGVASVVVEKGFQPDIGMRWFLGAGAFCVWFLLFLFG